MKHHALQTVHDLWHLRGIFQTGLVGTDMNLYLLLFLSLSLSLTIYMYVYIYIHIHIYIYIYIYIHTYIYIYICMHGLAVVDKFQVLAKLAVFAASNGNSLYLILAYRTSAIACAGFAGVYGCFGPLRRL